MTSWWHITKVGEHPVLFSDVLNTTNVISELVTRAWKNVTRIRWRVSLCQLFLTLSIVLNLQNADFDCVCVCVKPIHKVASKLLEIEQVLRTLPRACCFSIWRDQEKCKLLYYVFYIYCFMIASKCLGSVYTSCYLNVGRQIVLWESHFCK